MDRNPSTATINPLILPVCNNWTAANSDTGIVCYEIKFVFREDFVLLAQSRIKLAGNPYSRREKMTKRNFMLPGRHTLRSSWGIGTAVEAGVCQDSLWSKIPQIFSTKAVLSNLWHMRLHMYFGSKLIQNPAADPCLGTAQSEAQESTIYICSRTWLSMPGSRQPSVWLALAGPP